jgi:formylglycine-generating enzyme required for sulfatase activity/predicted Ser/Thr protein kinase
LESEPDPVEQAFEELVELALRGEAIDVESFLGERPHLSETARERLRTRARPLVSGGKEQPLPFEQLGDFRLLRRLGEGGMGVVYLARQESLGRLLALKLMRPEFAGASSAERRFEREARAIAKLRHPSIVAVHAAGEEQGVRYLAMEYIEGRSLDQVLREEGSRVSPVRAIRWGREIADALACAHAAGIVHRDVKPSNIRITADDRALLLDFGLARLEDASSLSASGQFRGTPYYASPEQVDSRSRPVDARTDVYSLGATLFQCLTGRPPFEGHSSAQVFYAILSREPARPRKLAPSISRDLETVLLKSLEKDPARRYADAQAFARDLTALLEMRPIEARPPNLASRCVKWSRRNRGTSLAAAVAWVLAVILIGSHVRDRLQRAQRYERELEDAQAARASGNFDLALRATERALILRPADGRALTEHAAIEREANSARARVAMENALAALERFRSDSDLALRLQTELLPLRAAVTSRPMSPEETLRATQLEDQLADARRSLEGQLAALFTSLNLARGLDPENVDADAVLADVYLERWRAAAALGDARGQRHYRGLVAIHDPAGRHSGEIDALVPLSIATVPPGAEVALFRYEDLSARVEGGEPRLVPVPIDGTPPREPGTWALRVVAAAGGLEPEDLVLSIAGHPIQGTLLAAASGAGVERFDRLVEVDGRPVLDAFDAFELGEQGFTSRQFVFERRGERFTLSSRRLSELAQVLGPRELVERGGVPIEVYRRGGVETMEAPAGLQVRRTAAPLFVTTESSLGNTPLAELEFAPGSYLALLRMPGHESLRLPFVLERGRPLSLSAQLYPLGTTPKGYVRVAAGSSPVGGDAEAFASLAAAIVELDDYWIGEREVGVVDYLEFVNDTDTLMEIDASSQLILVPRDRASVQPQGFWKRLEDGTFEPPAHTLEQPLHGISWHDAQAYVRWLNTRAKSEGSPYTYALPTEVEWERAARGADRRAYVFGNRFVPRWVKGFFSRDKLQLEPGLSFPIDESPYGAFDLTGNMWEWCEDEWLEGRSMRGGAWNFVFPPFFRAASRAYQDAQAVDGLYGLRLVARMNARAEEQR